MAAMTFGPAETVGIASVAWATGLGIRRAVPALVKLNLPASVLGGLAVAIAGTALRSAGVELAYDEALRNLLLVTFFTTIGLGARLKLLARGGTALVILLAVSSVFAVAQNIVGASLAQALGLHPLMGLLAGSVTLTGGPATGLAFGPEFEKWGVSGATTLAVASAMMGIVSAGLLGGPMTAFLLRGTSAKAPEAVVAEAKEGAAELQARRGVPVAELLILGICLGIGAAISRALGAAGFVLPGYIGAMIVAAVLRNLDDATGLVKLDDRPIQAIGGAALNLFIAMALVGLKLWELKNLAGPLAIILVVQIAFVLLMTRVLIHPMFGRDYESAVLSGGFVGYMLGITANAVANMDAVTARHGPAPRAYLVVPVVAGFLIDFPNALIIQQMSQWWR